jgi:hypothetical protein
MGLSWILFGGLRGFGRPPQRRHLPPEERDRLRRGLAPFSSERPVS